MTTLGKHGKARRGASKDKATPTNPTPPRPPKHTIQCALCDVVGHATHTCPELPHLKTMVNETFPESDIPEVYVTIPDSIPKLKNLHTNHPCSLCDFYGNYTHLCPRLDEYRSSLAAYRQFKATLNHRPSSLAPANLSTPIHISHSNIEMTEPSAIISYLSSSPRFPTADPLVPSPNVLPDHSSDYPVTSHEIAHVSPSHHNQEPHISTS